MRLIGKKRSIKHETLLFWGIKPFAASRQSGGSQPQPDIDAPDAGSATAASSPGRKFMGWRSQGKQILTFVNKSKLFKIPCPKAFLPQSITATGSGVGARPVPQAGSAGAPVFVVTAASLARGGGGHAAPLSLPEDVARTS